MIDTMKLYHLNPNDYGAEWFVMAESSEKAMECILNKLSVEADAADIENRRRRSAGLLYSKGSTCERDTFKMVKKFSETGLMRKYTLDAYNVNEVIESEIA
jgi:hypothetical protein